jgi:hypothetical protein
MDQKEFEVVSIIASRKTEFYVKTREKLLVSLPAFVDRKEARLRLRRAISGLDNSLFIAEEEKESKTINPKLSISQLKLDNEEIIKRVIEAMTACNVSSSS